MPSLAMPEMPEDTSSEQESSYDDGDEEEVEEVCEMSEEELLKMLDGQEPALQVCCRLFHQTQPEQASLKFLTCQQIMQLQTDGYLIIDGCLSAADSEQLHSKALQLHAAGSLEQAAKVGLLPDMALDKFTDVSARGDCITWLHAGASPGHGAESSTAHAVTKLEELQQDLHLAMNLAQRSAEYQLAVYPGGGSQYIKHRDALPDDGNDPNQRRVTAILYANPSWQLQYGGQLRIWLPPSSQSQQQATKLGDQRPQTEQSQQQTVPTHGQQKQSPVREDSQAECSQQNQPHSSEWTDRNKFGSSAASSASSAFNKVRSASSDQAADNTEGHQEPISEALCSSVLEQAGESTGQMPIPANCRCKSAQQTSGTHFSHADGEAVIDIDPLPGRLVVFLSGAIDHAVLPSHLPRVALTAWCC